MIEVNQLLKRFGAFTALHGISFEAQTGEILGFLGPNGAGKTTAMRILTGYMPPTSGTASVAGYDIFSQSLSARQHTGYLPETVPLYPDMTVQGYLHFMAEVRRVSQRRQRVRDVLALVGLEDRARALIRDLSKGMRQRVGLAQALIHQPSVLILDEPTIGLDPHQADEVRSLIRRLGGQHTILFSTHLLSEAEALCDRVVIIHQGKIVATGTPAALRDQLQPSHRIFVRTAGDLPDLRQLLAHIPGIETIEVQGSGWLVNAAPASEIRPAIAAAITSHGLELLELRPLAMTLEDIFRQYTAQQG